jgi:hypothetical protein
LYASTEKKLVSGRYECYYVNKLEGKRTFYTEIDRLRFRFYTGCIIIVRCQMERTAVADDLVTCPRCHHRDALTIRWIPEIDYRVHERTDLGCAACDIWFSEKEDKWAFAEWNAWACSEWSAQGTVVPHADLYRLLREEANHERAARAAAEAVSRYLEEHVATTCPWQVGDRFESAVSPHGVWSVTGVRAVYGTNTGPFWIVDAREVLSSGRLGHKKEEFWEQGNADMRRLQPFWRPNRWSHVHAGDECLIHNSRGRVVAVDHAAKVATVAIGEQNVEVTKLPQLLVPVSRLEADGT